MLRNFALAAALTATPTLAQILDGDVVATALGVTPMPGTPVTVTGGVYTFASTGPVTTTPTLLTGLSSELTGAGALQTTGANCVTILDASTLLVGEIAPIGESVDIHVLTLNGTQVVNDRKISVGTSTAGLASVSEIVVLSPDEIVFAVIGLGLVGPLQNFPLGRVDLRTGAVTPLTQLQPNLIGAGFVNALAASPDGTTLYAESIGQVLEIPLGGGGAPRSIAQFAQVSGLDVLADGTLLVASVFDVIEVDPETGAQSTRSPGPGTNVNGVATEAATQSALLATIGGPGRTGEVLRVDPDGTTTPILASPDLTMSGVDVLDNPRRYGTGTPGSVGYTWQVAPNAGGLPRLGNTSFAVRVVTETGGTPATPAFVLASGGESSITFAGLTLLVDLSLAISFVLPSNGVLSLPIPATAPLGADVFLQSIHFGSPRAASDGLRLRVMR